MSNPTASNYVLGQSAHEYERLMLQARMLRPFTEKFFRAAELAPGMRVLDIGSGMGDVALLSADIVGPGGRVLGIDRDAAALDNARRRAEEQGCSSSVEVSKTATLMNLRLRINSTPSSAATFYSTNSTRLRLSALCCVP